MKILLLPIFLLALIACSLVPTATISEGPNEPTQGPAIVGFTDEYVETLIRQYPYLNIDEFGTHLTEDALEQLNIDLDSLDLMGQRVGDCYDEFMYDLSPSYVLIIDRNACFGLRIWIASKSSSR